MEKKETLVNIIVDNLYKSALKKAKNEEIVDSKITLEEFKEKSIDEIFEILSIN